MSNQIFSRCVAQVSALAVLLMLTALPLGAQVRGDTEDVTHSMTFTTDQTDVTLDPNPRIGEDHRLQFTRSIREGGLEPSDVRAIATHFIVSVLKDLGVDVPSEVVDFVNGAGDFSNVSISPAFSVGLDADYGGYFEVNSIDGADVSVYYPVDVPISFPSKNTFACGDDIEVRSSSRVQGASMTVDPPFYNLELGPVFENVELFAQVGLKVSFCVGLQIPEVGCGGYKFKWKSPSARASLPINLPTLPPFINFCEDAYAENADMATLLG